MKYITIFVICLSLLACKSTPKAQLSLDFFQNTSIHPEYGYVADKPIKLGGFMNGTKYAGTHIEYFEGLTGPNGEIISVERLGSCCAFEDKTMPLGGGLLDQYKLSYEGLSKPLIIFVNLYQFEHPKAPYGLALL